MAALTLVAASAQTTYTPYTITTLAGTAGANGSANGTGSGARFFYPYGVAVDTHGNVYVADAYNHQIRTVNASGVVTTLASSVTSGIGSGTQFGILGGIAIDDADANLYATDYTSGSVYKISLPGGVVTLVAPAGTLNNPYGLALDSSGNIYVADSGNFVIRKITQGGTVSTLAGSLGNAGIVNGMGTAAQFAYPVGVALDGSGNIYVTDSAADAIRLVSPAGNVTTYAGQPADQGTVDGTLSSALFNHPTGIAIDSSGNIYLTDSQQLVRRISAAGVVSSLAGSLLQPGSINGTGSTALFSFSNPAPAGIAVDTSGAIYIADSGNDLIRKGVASTAVPPQIQTQPQNQAVNGGASVTFSVAVTGTGPFIYQWNLGGGAVIGATSSSYTIPSVQAADAGNYQVIISGAGGTVFSSFATLTVNGPPITAPPASQTVTAGSSPVLSVTATGTNLTYQWYYNGTAIPGATSASLTLSNVATTQSGSYTVVVSGSTGSATSPAATVTVNNGGRLINLSVLSNIQGSLSMGFVVGGNGSGPESLLIRGVGPSIGPGTAFNVPGVITDPNLTVVQQNIDTVVATNAGWGVNQAAVTAADTATGAFPLTNPASLDSAVVVSLPTVVGGYSATVAGKSGDNGYALTEVYDNTLNYTPAISRLVNLSCLTQVAAGGTLDVGFVIGGSSAETLLIRAAGPALTAAPFNVSGAMPDPQLSVQLLSSPNAPIATNAGWAGNAQVTLAETLTGAFSLSNPASKDSAVVVTLQPGIPYVVAVSSVSGTGGLVLVEIYEVQ